MDDTECIISNTEISIPQDSSTNENNSHGSTETLFETVQKSDIVSVLLTKTNQRQKNIMQIVRQAAAIQLCDANGSARSIIEWGCKCNLDNQLAELSNATEQLICCLHGPAGSGKSTVI